MAKNLRKPYCFALLILFVLLFSFFNSLPFSAYANSKNIAVYIDKFAGDIIIYDGINYFWLEELFDNTAENIIVYDDNITFYIYPINQDIEYQIQFEEEVIDFSGESEVYFTSGFPYEVHIREKQEAEEDPPIAQTFIVRFDIGDGSAEDVSLLTQELFDGEDVQEPIITPPKGFIFRGWDTPLDMITSAMAINGEVIVEAIYTILEYTVNYYAEGNLFTSTLQTYNSFLRLPSNNPTKTGYYLLQWEDSNNVAYDNMHKVTCNLNLHAVFERNQYVITYYDEDEMLGQQIALYGDTIPTIMPQKDGYNFKGWYTDVALSDRLVFNVGDNPIVEGDVSIYAKFEINNITISYNDNLQGAYQQVQVPAFSILELAPATICGYKVTAQAVDFQGVQYAADSMAINCSFRDIVVTYTYEKDTFYLTFICPSLPIVAPATIQALFEDNITFPTIEQKGYDFLGFYKDEQFTEAVDYNTMPYSASADNSTFIYIKLEKKCFTISFDTQGAQEFGNIRAEYGDSIDLESYQPSKINMVFLGWKDTQGIYQEPYLGSVLVDDDICLTAIFQLINEEFSISFVTPKSFAFELCDGEVHTIKVDCPNNVKVVFNTLPEQLPQAQAEGHTFLGWFLDKECTQSYISQPMVADATLYGKFEIITLTATFICRHKTIEKQVEYYSPMPEIAPFEVMWEYHAFSGWDKSVDYITEDIEFVALYTPLYNIVVLDKTNQMLPCPIDCELDTFLAALELPLEDGEVFLGWKLQVYDQDTQTIAYVPNIVKIENQDALESKDYLLFASLLGNLLLFLAVGTTSVLFRIKEKSITVKLIKNN